MIFLKDFLKGFLKDFFKGFLRVFLKDFFFKGIFFSRIFFEGLPSECLFPEEENTSLDAEIQTKLNLSLAGGGFEPFLINHLPA